MANSLKEVIHQLDIAIGAVAHRNESHKVSLDIGQLKSLVVAVGLAQIVDKRPDAERLHTLLGEVIFVDIGIENGDKEIDIEVALLAHRGNTLLAHAQVDTKSGYNRYQ